jgi:hypothetical protein
MHSAVCAALAASLALALTSVASGAASLPQIGRYKGQTGDGHVFQFSVERSHKANSPRKITDLWLVYDIADCRSGPVRQPFLASVFQDPGVTARRVLAHDPEDRRPRQPGAATPGGQIHLDDQGVGQLPRRRHQQVPDQREHPGAELHGHALGLALTLPG